MREVLLFTTDGIVARSTVLRGFRMAEAMEASLSILVVNPRHEPGAASIELQFGTSRCSVETLVGDVRELALAVTIEREPMLVILDRGVPAGLACQLVDRTRTGVLVSRVARPTGPFVAASAMQNSTYPVVSLGIVLSRRCRRDLVLVHNDEDGKQRTSSTKRARLDAIAGKRGEVEVVIAREETAEDAILDLATRRDADLVIVGRRARTWFAAEKALHLVEQILARCDRSVLVVPVAVSA